MKNATNTMDLIKKVKSYAKTFTNFDPFYNTVFQKFPYKGIMAKNEFDRLVTVASMEANLY